MKDDKGNRRVPAELRRVVANARDLWTKHTGGVRGVKLGDPIPDKARIDTLPASILTGALVHEYFKARQDGVLDVSEPQPGNTSINSTLRQARVAFSRKAMAYKYEKLKLPDVAGFMREPLLPQGDSEPHPVRAAEFDAMLAAAAAAPKEIALVNMILRQTGLRSGSLEALRADWLEKLKDGWWMHVRVRKGRTTLYSVPISRELAARILRRRRKPAVVLPDGTAAQRHELVHKLHNEWLKGFIGGAGERVQGNHRLRDTVATALLSWLGMDAAKLALGHADEKTTQKHYARLRIDVSGAMQTELVAWGRLTQIINKRGEVVHRAKGSVPAGQLPRHKVRKEELIKCIAFLRALVQATEEALVKSWSTPRGDSPVRIAGNFQSAALATPILLAGTHSSAAVRQMSDALWSNIWPVFLLAFAGSVLVGMIKSAGFKGWLGEAITRWFALDRLDSRAYKVFHDLYVPRPDGKGTTQIDHLVVSPFGVVVIETKNLSGWLFGQEREAEWTQVVRGQKRRFQNPLRQNRGHVQALREFLELPESAFKPVVWLIGSTIFKTPVPNGVLTRGLKGFIEGVRIPCLDAEAVQTAVARLAALERSTNRKAARREHMAGIMTTGSEACRDSKTRARF